LESFILAFFLSLLAGLSTTVGSFIAFAMKKPSPKFISFIMGFSAGIMILISFVELLQQSISTYGIFMGFVFFFIGMLIMLVIDIFISHKYEFEDSIEVFVTENGNCEPHLHRGHLGRQKYRGEIKNVKLAKSSLFIFLGVFIHNFPEGMVTFIGAVKDLELGLLLTLAIALHNIPEGIAVAVPLYACTGDKKKAFKWSFLSGISEPIGALITGFILFPFINDALLGALLGVVGGIMIYISLDELLPVSKALGKEHISILGIISGMLIMALSLSLFNL